MATIIKGMTTLPQSGPADRKIALDLTDLGQRADVYLDEVRAEAGRIIAEAKGQAEMIRRKAEQAGREAAEAAAEKVLKERVAQRMASLTPALQQAVRQVEDSRQEWLHHWEASAVRLASAIAARLVRRQLAEHRELQLEWIREALELAAGSTGVVLRLNPEDHEVLGDEAHKLVEQVLQPIASARIVADASITRGGCRVDTEFGAVDQQLETRLERLEQELL